MQPKGRPGETCLQRPSLKSNRESRSDVERFRRLQERDAQRSIRVRLATSGCHIRSLL